MIVIPGELISQKNSKRILYKTGMKTKSFSGKKASYKSKVPFIASSEAANKQRVNLVRIMKSPEMKERWARETKGKEYPYIIYYRIFRRTSGTFDYINIVQGLFDAMTVAKWIPDDDKLHIRAIPQGWEKDSDNPRIEFKILNKGQSISV